MTDHSTFVQFVSEVSSNHHQSLERCFQFIKASAEVGCSAVKFQLFKMDELFSPEILNKSEKHRQRKLWELSADFLPELSACCQSNQIQFSCTPFYLDAVEQLFPYVDFYKIASYELLWLDLLKACAQTGKPVVLSTGMATMDEIEQAVGHLQNWGCQDLTLLHCVSGYPTPINECNLAAIKTLRDALDCPVGWSDHSVSAAVIHRAVQYWQSSMVEFHLDLEGQGEEYGAGHCWLPGQIAPVIKLINEGRSADGSGLKIPAPCELPDRDWRADPDDGLRPLKPIRKAWRD